MIQDIAPHRLDNQFKIQKPNPTDLVFCIRDHKTLLKREEGDKFVIPSLAEAAALTPMAEKRAVYLFAIDEQPCFLVEIDKNEEPELPADGSFEWKSSQHFRLMEPMHQAFAAITATQLWRWRESRRFCGHCGGRMEDSRTERAMICPICGQIEYPKISPAVIVAITNGDKLLMSRYRGRSYGGYALIAGFVEIGESFEETVHREVMEEVGLKVKNIRYFKSQPWAFTDTEMIGFFAELDGDDTIKLEEEELSEAGWYTRDEIPDDESMISVASEMKMAFKYRTF